MNETDKALGMLAPEIERTVLSRYLAVRSAQPNSPRIAVLHIAAQQTTVALGERDVATPIMVLAIGSQAIAEACFKHAPASALELENAIAIVEDEIARARPVLPGDVPLHTADAPLCEIARLAGISDSSAMVLSREAVEQTFERMVSVALGRPAAQSGLPTDNEFSARLLILRELMHHLQLATIVCHRVG